MIIELRKKSQITIPKEIVSQLSLQEGDYLDVNIVKGIINIEPVAIYSKSYVDKLEQSVMMINEDPADYNAGPFSSVKEAIEYLESKPKKNSNDSNDSK